MTVIVSKELSRKIKYIFEDVIVKEGCVLTEEEQKEFDSLRKTLKSYLLDRVGLE